MSHMIYLLYCCCRRLEADSDDLPAVLLLSEAGVGCVLPFVVGGWTASW